MTHIRSAVLAASFAIAALSAATAQTSRTGMNQGYASDTFEGFEAIDKDTRIAQKKTRFWRSPSEDSAKAQLEHAQKLEAAGSNKSARKAYDLLVREWPTAPEAPQAQLSFARLLEQAQKYDQAFQQYQYLIVHYAGNCPYNEVLDRQFRIANLLLHENRSMFGKILSGTDEMRERFEQIVRNAPRSAIAPEAMLIVGSIRVSEKQLPEAISVYDGIMNRFPKSPQAVSAAFLSSQCRYELAVKHNYNETRCREGIAFFKAVLGQVPNHPQKEQMRTWLAELTSLLLEQNYQQALFYDTRQRNADAAQAAYRRFLSEFPDSKYAQPVRDRLAELEKGSTPLK